MPLEFNVGELARRLRFALGVRGRIPLDVDERTSASVELIKLDQAPWRSQGARWYGTFDAPLVAANYGIISIGAVDPNATIVVDEVTLNLGGGATSILAFLLGQSVAPPVGQLGIIPELSEPRPFVVAPAILRRGPVNLSAGASVAAPVITDSLFSILGVAGATRSRLVEVTIPAGWRMLLYARTLAVDFNIEATGRVFTGVQAPIGEG